MLFIAAYPVWSAGQDQAVVSGKVLDKAGGEPVAWATVALTYAEGTVAAGAACDDRGEFSFSVAPGTYGLSVSMMGYVDFIGELTVSAGDNPVGPFYLEQDAEMLAGARVSGKVNLVEMKIDRLVFNVSQSSFAQGSNSLELLRKAPGVTIDKDGNVKLNGQPVSIWIDGRPSYLDGKNLEAFLRSVDGGSIERFDIMANPSSKYDAEGQGGIIDIRTKRNLLAGLNGNVGAELGGMYFRKYGRFLWNESMSANLFYRTDKTNSFLNIYEGIDNLGIALDYDSYVPAVPDYFHNRSTSHHDARMDNMSLKFGNDWFLDKRNTLGFIVNVPFSRMRQSSKPEDNESGMVGKDGSYYPHTVVNTSTDNLSRDITPGANLNYTHVFDESRASEVTVNLDYYRFDDRQGSEQYFHPALADYYTGLVSRTVKTDNGIDVYSAKADYQSVLWQRVMFEAGAKWALSATGSNSVRNTAYTFGPESVEDRFTYRENVGAAYFNGALALGPKWSLKAGLRAEYTDIHADWITSGSVTRRNYLSLFPTVFLGFNPNMDWRLSASYTRRISRPGYYYLNPSENYVDAYTVVVGNPGLQPQFTNTVSLSSGYGQHLAFSIFYSGTRNYIMQMPYVSPDGAQFLKWMNYGGQSIAAVSLSVSSLPLASWLDWTASVNGINLKTDGPEGGIRGDSYTMSGYTALSFNLPRDWKVELDAYATLPIDLGYIETSTQWMSNLGVRKDLLDNALTLRINCSDLFRSQEANLLLKSADDSGGYTLFNQAYLMQKISVGLTWNFGKAQGPVRRRNVGVLEESSRTGSSSGISTGGAGTGGGM